MRDDTVREGTLRAFHRVIAQEPGFGVRIVLADTRCLLCSLFYALNQAVVLTLGDRVLRKIVVDTRFRDHVKLNLVLWARINGVYLYVVVDESTRLVVLRDRELGASVSFGIKLWPFALWVSSDPELLITSQHFDHIIYSHLVSATLVLILALLTLSLQDRPVDERLTLGRERVYFAVVHLRLQVRQNDTG